jgi:prephenate dehydrogenase
VEEVGNIIKINMYADIKKNNKLNLQAVEEIILKYKSWLEITNREDRMETYEEFLQVQ